MKTELSELAKALGRRGGQQTKKRGSAYFRRIGKLGLKKRWGQKTKNRKTAERAL